MWRWERKKTVCNSGGWSDLAKAKASCRILVRNRTGEGHSCVAYDSITFT